MLGQKLASIKSKLAVAFDSGALQPGLYRRNLGTSKWLLNPPATEETVKSVEKHFGIDLPTDYRRFVLELGDGGAGPYAGLLPLRWRNPPITASHRGEDGDTEWISVSLCLLPFSCCSGSYHPEWDWGLLALEGPMAGKVYYSGMEPDAEPDFEPIRHVMAHPDFVSWYEDWLDMVLRHEDTSYFGFDSKPKHD